MGRQWSLIPLARLLPGLFTLLLAASQVTQAGALEAADRQASERLKGEEVVLSRLDLRGATVRDALRMISELCGLNVAATAEAGARRVDLLLRDVNGIEAIESICKLTQLWYRRDVPARSIRVLTTQEYRQDQVVYVVDEIEVFTLRHPNAISVAGAIADLFGDRVELSFGIDDSLLDSTRAGQGLQGGLGGFGALGGQGGFGPQAGALGGLGGAGLTRSLQGEFSRAGSFGAGRFGRSTPRGSLDDARDLLEGWTSEQIARSELRQVEPGTVDAGTVRELWQRPAPIQVTVNRMHNLIVVRTSDNRALADIGGLIAELDRPMPQVLLEMQILELGSGEGFRSVFDIGFASGPQRSGPPDGLPPNPLVPDAPSAPRSILSSLQAPLEGGSLVYQLVDDRIRARIQLLEIDDRLRVVSRPILLAANDRPARLFVGEERVLVTGVETSVVTPASGASATFVQPVTEVRDVGNSLVIVPRINADRTVTLSLSQDSSSVKPRSATIPVVSEGGAVSEFAIDTVFTATLQATVVAKDGLTLAVGGLIRSEHFEGFERVPVLGSIPLLGRLFRREVRDQRESELLLLITPHVLFTPEEAAHWSDPLSRAHAEALAPSEVRRTPWRPAPAGGGGQER